MLALVPCVVLRGLTPPLPPPPKFSGPIAARIFVIEKCKRQLMGEVRNPAGLSQFLFYSRDFEWI